MSNWYKILFSNVLAISILSSPISADYEIRLLRASDHAKAIEITSNLSGLGYKSVHADNSEVFAAGFAYYPDALVALSKLKTQGFPDSEILERNETDDIEPFAFPDTRNNLFRTFTSAQSIDKENQLPKEDLEPIYSIIKNSTTEEAISDLEFRLANTDTNNPTSGVIATRLAFLNLRIKNTKDAEKFFHDVSTGIYNSPNDLRYEAIVRYGRTLHSQDKHLEAWELYREAFKFLPNGDHLAEVARQSSAIIMEFAKDKKQGTLDDSRKYFQEVLPIIEISHPLHASTIRLMEAETFYYEGNDLSSCEYFEKYLNDYQGVEYNRDIAMALTFYGLSLSRLKNYDSAREKLEAVLELDLTKVYGFAAVRNPKLHALEWLVKISEDEGRQDLSDHYSRLKNNYDNSGGN